MASSYPDICYSLDESHTGFDELILQEADHCLHVQLTAVDRLQTALHQRDGSQKVGEKAHATPIILLSGFVSQDQIAEALQKHGTIWQPKDKELVINMTGPGGKGAALVTAKWLAHENAYSGAEGSPDLSKRASDMIHGFKSFAKRLLPGDSRVRERIKCAMLEVNLPVHLLASLILGIEHS